MVWVCGTAETWALFFFAAGAEGLTSGLVNIVDCRDFASEAEAQAALLEDPSDPHNLDADDDGQACEDSSSGGPSTTDPTTPPPSSPPDPSPDSREPSPGPGTGRDLDCDDFSSQEEAQEVFEDAASDPHGLDADDDGEACED